MMPLESETGFSSAFASEDAKAKIVHTIRRIEMRYGILPPFSRSQNPPPLPRVLRFIVARDSAEKLLGPFLPRPRWRFRFRVRREFQGKNQWHPADESASL